MPQQYSEVDAILEAHGLSQAAILPILRDVQNHYRYLPQDVLLYIAKRLGVPGSKVFGVAAFDDSFSLEPKGKYFIKVCDGTACHMRKTPEKNSCAAAAFAVRRYAVQTHRCMTKHCRLQTAYCAMYRVPVPERFPKSRISVIRIWNRLNQW